MVDYGCVPATKEISSRSMGEMAVKNITTDGSGDGHVAHGMSHTPVMAFGIPLYGEDMSAAIVSVTATNIVIAAGGNTRKWVVVAIG